MSGQRSDWRERLHANPSRMEQELAIKLQDNGIHYQTQVEIPVTTADFYFPLESRPLLVFVDGKVHFGANQAVKDEELRTLLRKRGYRVLELFGRNHGGYGRKRVLLDSTTIFSKNTSISPTLISGLLGPSPHSFAIILS